MGIDLEASRLMVRHAAKLMTEGDPSSTMYSAMAKKFTTETCSHIVDRALQMHGGYGYLSEFPLERIYRDLRVHSILEGTSEVMLLIIQRMLFKD